MKTLSNLFNNRQLTAAAIILIVGLMLIVEAIQNPGINFTL